MSVSVLPMDADSSLRTRLRKFMSRPQRHRLLHGYPLAAAMPYVDRPIRDQANGGASEFSHRPSPGKPLLVGVLPHPFCNPKISGCGFCTFPHETFNRRKSHDVAKAVEHEAHHRLQQQPELRGAPVAGLYFGGGTANLTPPDPFRSLCRTFAKAFDLSSAEVSLEGVPSHFLRGQSELLDMMREEISARHFRISMGIQTFSERRLEQMGRLGFGRPSTFASVVDTARRRGMTVSGDLLFNLPGQTLTEMLDDVQKAVQIGLDQICLYHLVMFRGLVSVWSRDQSMLNSLPSNQQAAENWLRLRSHLLENGYRQTSLTNFERTELADDDRRYRYEPISYESIDRSVLGFGPAGISFSMQSGAQYALKTMNPESSAEYTQAVYAQPTIWNRYFQYDQEDLELLHFTRRLAALSIDKQSFTGTFGADAWTKHREAFDLLIEKGLLSENSIAYRVTPRGMFFSDAIAALLADKKQRLCGLKAHEFHNNNGQGYM